MEGLEELHNNIMFYLAIILFAVSWIMLSIILNYRKASISNKYVNHGTLVELIWTITPALILVLIAFPSFKLLYLMDEVIDPSLVIYGEGHQWYWSYQYPDFTNNDEEFVEFDWYIMPEKENVFLTSHLNANGSTKPHPGFTYETIPDKNGEDIPFVRLFLDMDIDRSNNTPYFSLHANSKNGDWIKCLSYDTNKYVQGTIDAGDNTSYPCLKIPREEVAENVTKFSDRYASAIPKDIQIAKNLTGKHGFISGWELVLRRTAEHRILSENVFKD